MNASTATEYDDLRRVSEPQLSPDDERVASVRRTPDDDDSYAVAGVVGVPSVTAAAVATSPAGSAPL
ncbi:hypothetical protein [Natronorubrum halophilum]|uniref:hypothetical protein n=1 Tax=Natronorubrum halophilum TaxID=1702106 RepID=UPI000EF65BBD|nr:hypothetical protein [Natronorubrum halophilum]